MAVEYVSDCAGGYWLAFGDGPLRRILVEGSSRREALRAFWGVWHEQEKSSIKC
jgi:hypothetical protein